MYNQNNMYNNFNNTGVYNQVYQPPTNNNSFNNNSKKGGGVGSFLFALILLVVLVLLLLRLIGVFDIVEFVNDYINKDDNNVTENVNKPNDTDNNSDKDVNKEENTEKEEVKEPVDPIKLELTNMCKSVDSTGNYHVTEYKNDLQRIQTKYYSVDGENVDEYFKEIVGIYACTNNECFKYIEDKKVAMYSCATQNYTIISIEEMYREERMNSVLDLSCQNLDNTGYFSGTIAEDNSVISCSNYVCKYTYQGVTKEKKCN